MPSSSAPHLPKHKLIRRTHPHSQHSLPSARSTRRHFLTRIRQVAHPHCPRPTNQLISFLNIRPHALPSTTSLGCIPSIEQMISQPHLQQDEALQSLSSIEKGFSSELISETNHDMRVMYVCLLRRMMRQLQFGCSVSQRRKVIRGTWNILAKYCRDTDHTLFRSISAKIEWGLLELINFDFRFSARERYNAEEMLREAAPEQQQAQSAVSIVLS